MKKKIVCMAVDIVIGVVSGVLMIITEDLTFAILDMVCCMGWSVLAGIKIPGLIDGRTDKHIHED